MLKKVALVTGAAGFIGYHISKLLLDEGWSVIGVDCISNYYDVTLKKDREKLLKKYANYTPIYEKIEKTGLLNDLFKAYNPEVVVHLAAQAGVRHSINSPRDYLESNIVGTFELLEAARNYTPKHLLLASTSSVYGANTSVPYKEIDKSEHQMSFYAATKKATENIAHSYSHLYKVPITMFRFFTVYGPWGRPDMALFKFTKAILADETIDIYNHGNMLRDFTYIDDLTRGIRLLINKAPKVLKKSVDKDSLSPIAPFRIVNIGNSEQVNLIRFIEEIENALKKKARKRFLPMQPGDVPSTLADTTLLKNLTNFQPSTDITQGIANFTEWYISYYLKK